MRLCVYLLELLRRSTRLLQALSLLSRLEGNKAWRDRIDINGTCVVPRSVGLLQEVVGSPHPTSLNFEVPRKS